MSPERTKPAASDGLGRAGCRRSWLPHHQGRPQHTAPGTPASSPFVHSLAAQPVSVQRVEVGRTRAGRRNGRPYGRRESAWGSAGPTLTLKAGRMAPAQAGGHQTIGSWVSRHVRGGRDASLPTQTHLGRGSPHRPSTTETPPPLADGGVGELCDEGQEETEDEGTAGDIEVAKACDGERQALERTRRRIEKAGGGKQIRPEEIQREREEVERKVKEGIL